MKGQYFNGNADFFTLLLQAGCCYGLLWAMKTLQQAIQAVMANTKPGKERTKALRALQWRMRGPMGEYVGLGPIAEGSPCQFVPEGMEQIFDGRDNEQHKVAYYQSAIGQPLTIEMLSCVS